MQIYVFGISLKVGVVEYSPLLVSLMEFFVKHITAPRNGLCVRVGGGGRETGFSNSKRFSQ